LDMSKCKWSLHFDPDRVSHISISNWTVWRSDNSVSYLAH
jgi:hypothetical protein